MVTATVWYSRLVLSVAEHLGVPDEETEPVKMSNHSVTVEVRPPRRRPTDGRDGRTAPETPSLNLRMGC